MVNEQEIIKDMKQTLANDVFEAESPKERRVFLRIKPEALRKAVKTLTQKYETRLITISAVDHGLDLEFLHHFHVGGNVVTFRTVKPKEDNTIDSVVDIVPAANFIEREISDLFGAKFTNHPQFQPLILPANWPNDKRPLRKPHGVDLPSQAKASAEALISSGCVFSVSSFIEKKRVEAGLPRAPPLTFTDEKAMKEFQSLMEESGFSEKVGYDMEKKRLRYRVGGE
ncbi:MAG: NADH-quinone oxidoreductase subunit C [Candidatus Bathyarchaeales archaeon]